jgi:hypothetical protein
MDSQAATRGSWQPTRRPGAPPTVIDRIRDQGCNQIGPWFLLTAALLLASGCGEPARPPAPPRNPDAAPAASDGSTRPVDAEPESEPDAAPRSVPDAGPPGSCVEIRNCIVRCETDATCAQRCVDQAPAAARAGHQAIGTCSRGVCQPTDINCRCEQECQGGGTCFDLVEECRGPGLAEDVFCDELCM